MSLQPNCLTGRDVLKDLTSFGFEVVSTGGSHVKLRRDLSGGERQILTIAIGRDLDLGTFRAILGQVSRFLSEDELRGRFLSSHQRGQ